MSSSSSSFETVRETPRVLPRRNPFTFFYGGGGACEFLLFRHVKVLRLFFLLLQLDTDGRIGTVSSLFP